MSNLDISRARLVIAVLTLLSLPGVSRAACSIVYTDNQDIMRIEPDGSGQVNLTPGQPGWQSSPLWSPDGSRILYTQELNSDRDIWVMNSNGTNQVNLTSAFGTWDNPGNWSPNGARILYWNPLGSFLLNPDGTNQTPLLGAGRVARSWSPDGSRIAFDYQGDIWTIDSAGVGSPQQITSGSPTDAAPDWSPDGSRFIFVRDNAIWVMDTNGANQHQVGAQSVHFPWPSWSPDGTQIVYALNGNLIVANADGSNPLTITHTGSAAAADWGGCTVVVPPPAVPAMGEIATVLMVGLFLLSGASVLRKASS